MTDWMQPPALFYGTAWREEHTAALTTLALRAGFRGLDTANQRRFYFEAGVGEAIHVALSESIVRRSQLFVQSKFTHANGHDLRLPYDLKAPPFIQVFQSFESSLQHLRISFLDSYLLHAPAEAHIIADDDWEVWQAIGELKNAGKVRFVGVSNVSIEQLTQLIIAEPRPAFVQNRCFARTGWDREVRAFCRAQGIGYQGFALLAQRHSESIVNALGQIVRRTRRTPAEVILRFAMHIGITPVTGTSNVTHMREDVSCADFELEEDEITLLEGGAD